MTAPTRHHAVALVEVLVKTLGRNPGRGCMAAATIRSQLSSGTRRSRSAATTSTLQSITHTADLQRSVPRTTRTRWLMGYCTGRWSGSPPTSLGGPTDRSRDGLPDTDRPSCACSAWQRNADSSDPRCPWTTSRLIASTGHCSLNGIRPRRTGNRFRKRDLDQFLVPLQHSTRPLRLGRTTTNQPARRPTTTCQVTSILDGA